MKEKIRDILSKTISQFNNEHKNKKIEDSDEQKLYGDSGCLDSLELVNFVVMVEANIEKELDKSIVIANEKAMSRSRSPFLSVGTLSEYILELIKENNE